MDGRARERPLLGPRRRSSTSTGTRSRRSCATRSCCRSSATSTARCSSGASSSSRSTRRQLPAPLLRPRLPDRTAPVRAGAAPSGSTSCTQASGPKQRALRGAPQSSHRAREPAAADRDRPGRRSPSATARRRSIKRRLAALCEASARGARASSTRTCASFNGIARRPAQLRPARRAARGAGLPARLLAGRRRGDQLPPLLRHQRAGRHPHGGPAGLADGARAGLRLIARGARHRAAHRPPRRPASSPPRYFAPAAGGARSGDAAPAGWPRRPTAPASTQGEPSGAPRSGSSARAGRGPPRRHRPLYVVVEKILARDEQLPERWAVHGTTGYDFMNAVNGLFVDRRQRSRSRPCFARFTGLRSDFAPSWCDQKRRVMTADHGQRDQRPRPPAQPHLRDRTGAPATSPSTAWPRARRGASPASRSTAPTSPRRGGVRPATAPSSRPRSLARAGGSPGARPINLRLPPRRAPPAVPGGISRRGAGRRLEFVLKLQQVTAPVMAKAVEDTSSTPTTGSSPQRGRAGTRSVRPRRRRRSTRATRNRAAHWPGSLLATSTHDTKRSEDVRARIDVAVGDPGRVEPNEYVRGNDSTDGLGGASMGSSRRTGPRSRCSTRPWSGPGRSPRARRRRAGTATSHGSAHTWRRPSARPSGTAVGRA